MSLDHALSVQLLGRSEVVRLSIDEIAGLEILDSHGDGEGLVGGDSAHVGRERKLRRGHEVNTGDDTDWSRVARSTRDLLAVGDGEIRNGQTEIDEVVRRCKGCNLT